MTISLPIVPPTRRKPGTPSWSVMIPVYNPDWRYLCQTLDSVVVQRSSSRSLETEIVDDASPGLLPAELTIYADQHGIALHREAQNRGLARAWNRCISRARGEYVHILHQDDFVLPGFYEAVEEGLRRHPEAGAAFCRHAYCDEAGETRYLSALEQEEPGILPDLLSRLADRDCIQCASIVVRKSTYEKLGGYHEELVHALDWEMWIRIANSFPVYYEPRVLACWRQHGDATTSRQILRGENTRDIARAIGVWSKYVRPEMRVELERVARRRFALSALGLADYLARAGEMEGFRRQLESALLCDSSLGIRSRALLSRVKGALRPYVSRFRRHG